jgi:hypothetical protein
LKSKKIVISGINMVEGGIFTILHNVLQEISIYADQHPIEVIALVHSKKGIEFPAIQYLEFPDSKKSWFKRLYYEYFYFKKLSKKLKPLHGRFLALGAFKQSLELYQILSFKSG